MRTGGFGFDRQFGFSGLGDDASAHPFASHALALDFKNEDYWVGGSPVSSGVSVFNYVLYSQQIDHASWTKGGATITANAIAAPNGASTADTITEDTATSEHYTYNNLFTAFANGVVYTSSIFVKAGTVRYIAVRGACSYDGTLVAWCVLDTDTGTIVGTSGANTTNYVIDWGGGWFRVVMVQTNIGANGTMVVAANDGATAPANNAYTGRSFAGTSRTFYAWQAQIIAGNHPTGGPIILTTSAFAGSGVLALSGASYTRSGAKSELSTAGAFYPFAANDPGIVPGEGYWARASVTNRLPDSRDLTTANWTKEGSATVTTDGTTRADGTGLASKLSGVGGAGQRIYGYTGSNAVGTNSFFIKKISSSGTLQAQTPADAADYVDIDFSLLGSGWTRIYEGHPAITATGGFGLDRSSGTLFTVASGTLAFYIDHANSNQPADLVNGGPIIATAGAAATIGADVLSTTVNPIVSDVDFIWWAVANLSPQNSTYRIAAAMGGPAYVGFAANNGYLVADGTGEVSAGAYAAGRNVVMMRRRGGKTTLAYKKPDSSVVIGTESGARSWPATTSTLHIGNYTSNALQLDGSIEGIFIRTGSFDDGDLTTLLTAA